MICDSCYLPDNHRGQGDGIGSCDCPRCDCCEAAPQECDCARDVWDPEERAELADDFLLCSDIECPTRIARAASAGTRARYSLDEAVELLSGTPWAEGDEPE